MILKSPKLLNDMKNSKSSWFLIVISLVFVIGVGLGAFLINHNKTGIHLVNDYGKIPVAIQINRNYSNKSLAIYQNKAITSTDQSLASEKSKGESDLSLKISAEEQVIVGYIDANTTDFYLQIKIVDYDKTTGKISLAITYQDGMNDVEKKVLFEE